MYGASRRLWPGSDTHRKEESLWSAGFEESLPLSGVITGEAYGINTVVERGVKSVRPRLQLHETDRISWSWTCAVSLRLVRHYEKILRYTIQWYALYILSYSTNKNMLQFCFKLWKCCFWAFKTSSFLMFFVVIWTLHEHSVSSFCKHYENVTFERSKTTVTFKHIRWTSNWWWCKQCYVKVFIDQITSNKQSINITGITVLFITLSERSLLAAYVFALTLFSARNKI